jgi:hypothetical protein
MQTPSPSTMPPTKDAASKECGVQGVEVVDGGVSVVVPLKASAVLAVVTSVGTSPVVFDLAVVGTSVLGTAELGTVVLGTVLGAAVVGAVTVVLDTVVFGSVAFDGEATVVVFVSISSVTLLWACV